MRAGALSGWDSDSLLNCFHVNFLIITYLGVLVAGWILERLRVAVASLAFGPHTDPFFEGSIGALTDSTRTDLTFTSSQVLISFCF